MNAALHSRRVLVAIALPILILVVGTLGYWIIEDWPLAESLYMTVITISTVGYGELHQVSGAGRVFTMALILASLGTMGYSITAIAGFLLEGEFQRMLKGRRMDKRITDMRDHVVVCGLGRTGRSVVSELLAQHQTCVVVDRNDDLRERLAKAELDVPCIQGDATDDSVLRNAGIDRAKGLVTVLENDRDNVFVVLTARELSPSITIISRLDDAHNEPKLRAAGANQVVSPNRIGGLRMATLMTHRESAHVSEVLMRAGSALEVGEIPVLADGPLANKRIAELKLGTRHAVQVIGIRCFDGSHEFGPTGERRFKVGEVLLILGEQAKVDPFSVWALAGQQP
ncbi:MAG: NAD-binding protein [Planctomycetota bacterium]|nr:NAD-binding protein [Planctomycetota bacterium]